MGSQARVFSPLLFKMGSTRTCLNTNVSDPEEMGRLLILKRVCLQAGVGVTCSKCLKSRGMMGSKVQVKGQEERHFLPCNRRKRLGSELM